MKSAATLTPPEDEAAESGSDKIRESIRDAIVERRLAPGTKLTESEVGSLFNVSRTLARAALQALSFEGLVRVEKNRGAFVAYPSPEEARQIFAARRLIEPGILRAAAARLSPANLKQLKRLLAEEDTLMARHAARRAEIKASGDFHLTLAEIAGNPITQRFMDELVARSSLVIALYGQSTASSCGHSEHSDILAAIERKDLDSACELLIAHITHIENDLDMRERKTLSLREAFEQ